LFIPLLIAQGDNLSLLNTKAIEKNVLELYGQLNHFFTKHHFNFQAFIKESNLSSKVDFALLPNFLNSIIGFISDFGMALGSVLFITFFFLKDKKLFTQAAKTLLPDQHEDKILNSLDKINNLLSRYFIGIIIQLSFVFILYLIVLLIFGIQNALVIAFLCAVLNIVPYIGPLIASILAAILTMINYLGADFQKETLPTTIYVLLGFWVVQIIDNNVCQPIIFSNSVKSHPLEIFIVILLAGFSIGIVGMIVAIPCYTMLKVVGKEFLPDNKIIQLLTKNI
jgi:predicted PurR-regulated permease PerM